MNSPLGTGDKYFIDIISSIQCLSLKNRHDFLYNGVGGYYWGAYIDNNSFLKWPPDLLYKIMQHDKSTDVSIVSWNDSILISSNYNNTNSFFIEKNSTALFDDQALMLDTLTKVVQNRIPYAIINYDFKFNVKQIDSIHGLGVNDVLLFRQIRISHSIVNYFTSQNPIYPNYLNEQYHSNDFFPTSYLVDIPSYHGNDWNNILNHTTTIDDEVTVFDLPFEIDLPFWEHYKNEDISKMLDSLVHKYSNVIVIDSSFLERILMERVPTINKINPFKSHSFDLSNLILQLKRVSEREFSKYSTFLLDDGEGQQLYREWLEDWKKEFSNNFFMIEIVKNEETLSKNVISLLQSYYYDESYYHLDKLIFLVDSKELCDCLTLAPFNNTHFNKNYLTDDYSTIDILLGKNYNNETNMDGRFIYFVPDLCLWHGFKLNEEAVFSAELLFGST